MYHTPVGQRRSQRLNNGNGQDHVQLGPGNVEEIQTTVGQMPTVTPPGENPTAEGGIPVGRQLPRTPGNLGGSYTGQQPAETSARHRSWQEASVAAAAFGSVLGFGEDPQGPPPPVDMNPFPGPNPNPPPPSPMRTGGEPSYAPPGNDPTHQGIPDMGAIDELILTSQRDQENENSRASRHQSVQQSEEAQEAGFEQSDDLRGATGGQVEARTAAPDSGSVPPGTKSPSGYVFTCGVDGCERKFENLGHLKDHEETQHPRAKTHTCGHCKQWFRTEEELDDHGRTAWTIGCKEDRRFRREVLARTTREQDSQTPTPDQNGRYRCPVWRVYGCDLFFTTLYEANNHKESHWAPTSSSEARNASSSAQRPSTPQIQTGDTSQGNVGFQRTQLLSTEEDERRRQYELIISQRNEAEGFKRREWGSRTITPEEEARRRQWERDSQQLANQEAGRRLNTGGPRTQNQSGRSALRAFANANATRTNTSGLNQYGLNQDRFQQIADSQRRRMAELTQDEVTRQQIDEAINRQNQRNPLNLEGTGPQARNPQSQNRTSVSQEQRVNFRNPESVVRVITPAQTSPQTVPTISQPRPINQGDSRPQDLHCQSVDCFAGKQNCEFLENIILNIVWEVLINFASSKLFLI